MQIVPLICDWHVALATARHMAADKLHTLQAIKLTTLRSSDCVSDVQPPQQRGITAVVFHDIFANDSLPQEFYLILCGYITSSG